MDKELEHRLCICGEDRIRILYKIQMDPREMWRTLWMQPVQRPKIKYNSKGEIKKKKKRIIEKESKSDGNIERANVIPKQDTHTICDRLFGAIGLESRFYSEKCI